MNYIERARAILIRHLEVARPGSSTRTPPAVLENYLLLMLTTGEFTTLRHVHNAWAVARRIDRADSPDMIPFSDLSPEVAERDRPYSDAIKAAAYELRNN